MEDIFDLIIIGSGPAGLTCGIYGKRAELSLLVLEDPYNVRSQITNTYDVDNYPGFHNIDGQSLYDNMRKHAEDLQVNFVEEKVLDIIDIDKDIKRIVTKKGFYNTKNVVIATGATPKKLLAKGEDEFIGRGVSYCATCDGAFFKNKIVAVVGGGDVAIEDALFLSNICSKVYIIIRKNYMRATKVLQTEVLEKDNIEILYNTKINEICGDNIVNKIMIENTDSDFKMLSEVTVDGVFVAVGIEPNTDLVKTKINIDNGFIVASEDCKTSINGVYAIGDVRTKNLRQVVTACADGANAITSIMRK